MVQTKLLPKKITREELNSLVDKAADIIRTATDYKFILVLLFLKRISDTWKEEFKEKKRELLKYLDEKTAEREAENEVYHTFNLKRELLWDEITKNIKKLPENLSNALIKIAGLNKDLKGVIDKFSFIRFTTQEHREKLRQLVELFNQYNFSNKYVSSDIVGDAYEHILRKFIPMTKKEAKQGEFYTPREVVQLLVEILDPKPGQTIYDPACGFGGMLIFSYKHVREKYGGEEKLLLYGQEYSPEIYGLCKLNLISHGIIDAFIEYGDSLLYPRFSERGKLKQFDMVIANPPWNQDGYGEETLRRADFKERYFLGFPPNDKADWAWIQHMLASSKEKVGIVLDQGALFRPGSEKNIRKQVIERDLIECVVLLPPKIFYNTPASGVIIIFNKNKQNKGRILFVNAIQEFGKHPTVKRLNILEPENIAKIVKAYREFKEIEGFSKVVNLDEIKKNDYSLNVTLYASQLIEEEEVDLKGVYGELESLRIEREKIWKEIKEYIKGTLEL
jgi:type I restriction enzyme M protein